MFRAVVFMCGLCFLALMSYSVDAMTPDQKAKVKEHFEQLGMECIVDNQISEQDINDLRAKKMPTGPAAPCFIACIMKKTGLMNEQGMMQSESALDIVKKVFDDEEEVQIIHDYLHSCHGVNSEAVSDGEKGCDRAVLALKCMMENAPKFGLDV